LNKVSTVDSSRSHARRRKRLNKRQMLSGAPANVGVGGHNNTCRGDNFSIGGTPTGKMRVNKWITERTGGTLKSRYALETEKSAKIKGERKKDSDVGTTKRQ